MNKRSEGGGLVYSTDVGRMCPACGKPAAACVCKAQKKEQVKGSGAVRVRRETGGRAGKTVTTVRDLPLNENALKEILSELKRLCGSGGTVKEGVIEIQGDHCDKIIAYLSKKGFASKRAGG